MNKRQAERLLRVARALREYEHPERFSMEFYLHGDEFSTNFEGFPKVKEAPSDWCGTPGCALGTFSSRPDLQRLLTVCRDNNDRPFMAFRNGEQAFHDNDELNKYFGINEVQSYLLFGNSGCAGAQTPIAAAKFIEKFVADTYTKG